MRNKKIFIHSIAFSPDGVSTAYLYNDIATSFKNEGYDVKVLTTTPHYNIIPAELTKQPLKAKFGGIYYESLFNDIEVIHIPQKKYKSTALRILGFFYWHFLAFFIIMFERNIGLVISPSPPLSIGFINIITARLKGFKVIYNVQEIYPDFLIQQRALKSKVVIKFLTWLEHFVYNKSTAVTTIDPVFYEIIKSRFEDQSKLHLIPNFVDTDLYKPIQPAALQLDQQLFPDKPGVLKLMYAGNIGFAQDWEPFIALASELRHLPVEFFLIGEGAMKQSLQQEIVNLGVTNVHLIPYQPREIMPQLIAYGDMHFIFMDRDMEKHGFPSKVYTIMACAKPLLISSGTDTPIVNFLKSVDCAFITTETEFEAKCKELAVLIKTSINNLAMLTNMGQKGYDEVIEKYSKQAITSQYLTLVNDLLQNE